LEREFLKVSFMSIEPPANSIHPKTRAEWRTWLSEHQNQTSGVWLISYKKAAGKPQFDYDAAVEEALCFGWIDSKPNKLDEERTMLWFAPRKPGTGWSKPNKDRIERAIANGQMTPAGMSKIEAAKLDGSWSKLDAVENLEIPDDLSAALADYPPAPENFNAFPRSVKRGILEWIVNAKTTPTREKRILETATLAAQNLRANQWRKK
jgi:uncharacterized protein YdeI (YjbR/CyaY-like superfamily)